MPSTVAIAAVSSCFLMKLLLPVGRCPLYYPLRRRNSTGSCGGNRCTVRFIGNLATLVVASTGDSQHAGFWRLSARDNRNAGDRRGRRLVLSEIRLAAGRHV